LHKNQLTFFFLHHISDTKCSLNLCVWHCFISHILQIFQFSTESIFYLIFKIKNFRRTADIWQQVWNFLSVLLTFFNFDNFSAIYACDKWQNIQKLRRGFLARRPRYFLGNFPTPHLLKDSWFVTFCLSSSCNCFTSFYILSRFVLAQKDA